MIKKLTLLLLLVFPLSIIAQNYVIKNLGIKEGLSNNRVLSIKQDKRGFMWFATEEGLNMFNGINFRSYYKEKNKAASLSGNELNDILDDPKDPILWIATQRAGLNAYNYEENKISVYTHNQKNPHSLITNDITKLSVASDGNLWICTYWKGIDYFNKKSGQFSHYNTHTIPGLPSNNIWTVLDGANGFLYIGHVRHGFSILNLRTKKVQNFRHIKGDNTSLPSDEVTCIYKDKLNNIWVGTTNGVALYNPLNEKFLLINDNKQSLSHKISSIEQTKDNKLWIAMELGGIAIIDLSQNIFYPQMQAGFTILKESDDDYGLSGNSIRCLFQDSYSNIWIGGWGSGIDFISQETPLFNNYKYFPNLYANSLTNKTASCLCFDKSGRLWIGTDGGGINLFQEGKRIKVFKSDEMGNSNNFIQASFCDSKGGLWFGSFYGDISYCNPQTFQFKKIKLTDSNQHFTDIRSFFEDENGIIWVGTSEGIYLVERDSKKIVKHFSVGNNLVRTIYKDSKGRIWVGFFGDGVSIFNANMKRIAYYSVENNFPSNTVNTIVADRNKNIWIGTGEGAVRFDAGSTTRYQLYNRSKGLENDHIYAITEDKESNIWLSTNRGISCIVKGKNKIFNYDHRENVPYGSFFKESVAKNNENIYFGSIDGLCFFNPENVLSKRKSPHVIINSIDISGVVDDDINDQDEIILIGRNDIKLSNKQRSFTIHFNIQNYAIKNMVDYAYQLEGLSKNWYTINNTNSVTIRDLPPGNYVFRIKCRIHNQEWSNDISSISISIAPPLWLTWWAKVIYILLFVAICFYIIRQYKSRLEAESHYEMEKKMREHEQDLNNEKLRFYTNITHELKTPLTLIIGPLEDLIHKNALNANDSQKINVIHKSAIRLLDLINKLLEFRKVETQNRTLCVEKENIVPQIEDICQKYQTLNMNKNVVIMNEIKQNDITFYYDKDIIQIIMDNLISNSIKHTDNGSITIGIDTDKTETPNKVKIWVSDTGHGISKDALPHIFERYYQEKKNRMVSGTGIGLSLVKKLVDLHEGGISVESVLNEGTTFTVSLLLDNSYPNALHSEKKEEKDYSVDVTTELEEDTKDKNILLIVEDNMDIAEYIADSFKDEFEIHIANDGEQGKNEAIKIIPDIIVSDIMMPIMDGNTMCKMLKNDMRTSHIPIILLTAKDTVKDKETGYQVGADSYLTKPFSSSLLKSRIDNLLNSRLLMASYYQNKQIISKNITPTNKEEDTEQLSSINALDNEFMQKLNNLIEDKIDSDKIDIAYLTDKMFMSSSTLYRKMKALTGLSTNEYIRKMKMKQAKKLLMERKYNISEIATRVGFNNLFYFRQCFKEEFGMTPSELLNKSKK